LTKFAAVNALSFAMVWLVSVSLLRYGLPYLGVKWHLELVEHMIGVASPTVFSYYAHKFFTFRTTQTVED
jgi:putative flippase GtrA